MDATLSPLEQRVWDAVDHATPRLLSFLHDLVVCRSLYGEEAEAQRRAAAALRDLGLKLDVWEPDAKALASHPAYIPLELPYRDRPNVVGVLAGSGGGRSLLFNAHIDVVPPGNPAAWQDDPWTGRERDGHVWGRGTADMKGALAAFVVALAAVREATRLRGDVIVESVIEEENSGNGTLAAVLRGYRADGAIVGEPTSLDLLIAHQGSLWFRLTVPGLAAHAAYKSRGVSALEKAMVLYDALMALERERQPLGASPLFAPYDNPTPIAIGTIHAGDWPATIPDVAVLEGRLGVLPSETLQDVQRAVEACIARAGAADAFLRTRPARVEWFGTRIEPSAIPVEHPLVGTVRGAVDTVQPCRIYGKLAGTDMRHLVLYGDTPTVILGPGDDLQAHVANESVAVERLVQAAKIYALVMLRWCA